jgi:hypothetical protein
MPTPEASVYNSKVEVGPVKGIRRTGEERREDLSSWNAVMASGGRRGGKGTVVRVREVKGAAIVE